METADNIDIRLDAAARRELGDWLYGRLVETIAWTGDPVTVPMIVEGALQDRYQIHQAGQRGICVTKAELSYEGKVLNLLYSAGDLRVLLDEVLPRVIQHGTDNGCAALIAYGRRGWSRIAPLVGFKPEGERYVRPLPNKKELP